MHLIQRYFILLCGLLMINTVFAQQKSFHLRNAYEISGWLYKVDKGIYSPKKEEKEKILGSLIWYANLQDSTDAPAALNSILKKYPTLFTISNKLIRDLASIDTFFNITLTERHPSLMSITDINLRNKVESFNKKYRTALEELKQLENEYTEQANDIVTQLPNIQARITTEKNSIKQFELDSLYVIQQLNDTTFTDRNGLFKKQKVLKDTLSNRRKSLNTAEEKMIELQKKQAENNIRLKLKKSTVESLKIEIENFFEANVDKLSVFIIGLNGGDLTYSGIASAKTYSNAFYQLSHDEDYQFQSKLYLWDAQQYKGFKLPSQTDAIEAVAIYLAKRIKQESVMWFFEMITRNAERFELIKTFFPTTIKLLQSNENYEIPNLGTQWRYSLSKDFMQMPNNILQSDWIRKTWSGYSDYEQYFRGACEMAELVLNRYSYKDIIRSLYLSQNVNTTKRPITIDAFEFNDLIRFLYAVNNELFIPDTSAAFRPLMYEDMINMTGREMEIMISLIDLKYNGIIGKIFKKMNDSLTLDATLTAENVRYLLGNVQAMIRQIEIANIQFVEAQKKAGENDDVFFNAYNIWRTFGSLLKVLTNDNAKDYLNENLLKAKTAFSHVEDLFEVYNLLSKKNFSGAVLNTIGIVEKLIYTSQSNQMYQIDLNKIPDKIKDIPLLKEIEAKLVNVKVPNGIDTVLYNALNQLADRWCFEFDINEKTFKFQQKSVFASVYFEKDRHALQLVRKLSGFLNDVAVAKDEKQLAKVVESYALPVGSYKRKRNNWASLDINAFAGAYIGYENALPQPNDLSGNPAIKNVKTGGVWGLSVPIGISYSTVLRKRIHSTTLSDEFVQNPDRIRFSKDGRRSQLRTKSTLTFTASIIDLGAIVSYRLFNSSDKPLGQDLKWSQFISPGFHMSLAIKSTPLVWNWGVQYTPQLRKFEEAGIVNDKQYNATRFYTGIFFDLPLFNLWERKHITSHK